MMWMIIWCYSYCRQWVQWSYSGITIQQFCWCCFESSLHSGKSCQHRCFSVELELPRTTLDSYFERQFWYIALVASPSTTFGTFTAGYATQAGDQSTPLLPICSPTVCDQCTHYQGCREPRRVPGLSSQALFIHPFLVIYAKILKNSQLPFYM